MTDNSMKTHPLIVIAATAVILTCLLAIGVMTGIIPSPLTRDKAGIDLTVAPPPAPAAEVAAPSASKVDEHRTTRSDHRASLTDNQHAPRRPAPPAAHERTAPLPPVGSTAATAASSSVAGSGPARNLKPVCHECGRVTSVRAIKQQADAGLVGPIAGGALGGLVGSQIGGGSGRTIATIAGAAGGAALGTEVERRYKATTTYVVNVRLNDGTTRSFNYGSAPGVQEGDRIRVVNGRLVRRG